MSKHKGHDSGSPPAGAGMATKTGRNVTSQVLTHPTDTAYVPRMMSPRRLGVIVGLSALILAGCTDGGDNGDDDKSADDLDYAGPLAEFFGWEQVAPEGEAAFTETERRNHFAIEEYLVECMQELGFEYQPMPFWGDTEANFTDPNQEVWDLKQEDPEAFAKQYGYGITTIEYDYTEPVPTDPAATDPNYEYRESLSEDARAVYDESLYGDCYEQANQQVHGTGEDAGIEQFEEFLAEMGALYDRVRTDPRVVEARQGWSTCMADAGYPGLEALEDAQTRVTEKQGELYGWDEPEPDPAPAPTGTAAPGAPGTVAPGAPPEVDPEIEAEVRDFELAIAWADYGCQQDTEVKLIEREVQFELEEAFLADHEQQAEAYREWLDGQERVG